MHQSVSFAAPQSQVKERDIERIVADAGGEPRKLLSALSNKTSLDFTAGDERRVQESLEYSQTGSTIKWNNDAYGAVLTITPTYSFRTKSDIQCRGYKIMLLRGAKQISANDSACRYENGWFAGAPTRSDIDTAVRTDTQVISEAEPVRARPASVPTEVAAVEIQKPKPSVAVKPPTPKVAPKRVVKEKAKPARPVETKKLVSATPPAKVRSVKPVATVATVKPETRTPVRTPSGDDSIYVTADTDLSTIPVIANSANLKGALYESTNPAVATVNSTGKVSIVAIGTATIIVTLPGDANFNTAVDSYTLAVVRSDQAGFTIGDDVKKTFGDGLFAKGATGGQGQGTVSYHSSNASVATVNPNSGEVVVLGAGEATITATKAGDSNFNEISDSYDVIVGKADRSVFAVGGNEKRTYIEREFIKPIKTE